MSKTGDTSHLRPIPQLIFGSRWLQLPLYLGPIIAQGVLILPAIGIAFVDRLGQSALAKRHKPDGN